MDRVSITPRPDYVSKVESLGLVFHTVDDQPYWNESAYYRLTADEVDTLESATQVLFDLCMEAVDFVLGEGRLGDFGIPESAHKVIGEVWDADPPSLYGRFDLAWNPGQPPKMLEFNADTPTSLLEAAVIQWHWLQEVFPNEDQFNSIWDGLAQKWKDLASEGYLKSGRVHFACGDAPEDFMTTAVLMDTATEAGLEAVSLGIEEIGWDTATNRFVGTDHLPMDAIFKLYPWEWMLSDQFGPHALRSMHHHIWMEPIWKMVLSNKAILAILWEMFPGHENLLPAYIDGPRELGSYVKKPLLGREGANVTIVDNGREVNEEGPYGSGPFVFQEYRPLPVFDGNHAVIGSWVVDCVPRGIGIRESDGPITQDLARFVPHCFSPRNQL